MSNNFRLDELKQKVKQLADLDQNFQIHGSEVHHYQFSPCLSFSSLQDFEEQYQITFPEDYRYFLLNMGRV